MLSVSPEGSAPRDIAADVSAKLAEIGLATLSVKVIAGSIQVECRCRNTAERAALLFPAAHYRVKTVPMIFSANPDHWLCAAWPRGT